MKLSILGVETAVLLVLLVLSEVPAAPGPEDLQQEIQLQAPACYTLFNNAGPVGCRSEVPSGAAANLIIVDTQGELDSFVSGFGIGGASPGMLLLDQSLLTKGNLDKLQASGKCSGLLIAYSGRDPAAFSPAPRFPYCKCSEASACSGAWNPLGLGITSANLDFGMIALNQTTTDLMRKKAKKYSSDFGYPQYVVEMKFYMDAFQGYKRSGGVWWEVQEHTRCCRNCKPDCGSACCDKAKGFKCLSSTTHPNVSWPEPTCSRLQSPNSVSCLERGSCLPLGGFNVWSIAARSLPLKPKQPSVLVLAAMDSNSLFHDMAFGAVADASGAVALIAAADALRSWRSQMDRMGAAVPVFGLLQGEAYDHIGSRRLLHDILDFRCKEIQEAGDDTSHQTCLNPLMLSPEISQLNMSDIDFILEIDQISGDQLFLHTGCSPSSHTSTTADKVVSISPMNNSTKIVRTTEALPFPTTSAASAVFSSAKPNGIGLLAGYDSSFNTPYYFSQFDRGQQVNLQQLCRSASALARAVYTIATKQTAPPIGADCSLIQKLSAYLIDEKSSQYLGTAYTGIYQPPSLRGPTKRERFLHSAMAQANANPDIPSCDCCSDTRNCTREPYTECIGGRCIKSYIFFEDALPLGISWDIKHSKFVVNKSRVGTAWAESNWQSNIGAKGYLQDSPQAEQIVVLVGVLLTAGTAAATSMFLRYYDYHFKES